MVKGLNRCADGMAIVRVIAFNSLIQLGNYLIYKSEYQIIAMLCMNFTNFLMQF
jgi:hypothetical protein